MRDAGCIRSFIKKGRIMKIVKVIEVIASSDKGFTEATQNAVREASETVQNIKSVYIKHMKANVEDTITSNNPKYPIFNFLWL